MEPKVHNWKLSWPGNYCKTCGIDDPLEQDDALINCTAPGCTGAMCNECPECKGTGCVINPNLVIPECIDPTPQT